MGSPQDATLREDDNPGNSCQTVDTGNIAIAKVQSNSCQMPDIGNVTIVMSEQQLSDMPNSENVVAAAHSKRLSSVVLLKFFVISRCI